jgi:predicted transcriptional regulator
MILFKSYRCCQMGTSLDVRGVIMGTQTDTRVLTAHVPIPLAEKVDQMAVRLERSRGWIIKQALSAWVEQEEDRYRLTLEALADVDSGRVIDLQALQAWADSLERDEPLPIPY